MSKKPDKDTKLQDVSYNELVLLDQGYADKINNDIEYSLEVDPLDLYRMSGEKKEFVKNWVQYKNFPAVCQMTGIDEEVAKGYFNEYGVQQEIRRINLAVHARQFSSKMLGINEIGGYLTSLITDVNVPYADRLTPKDKLTATKMLMELNEMKKQAYDNPMYVDAIEIENDLENLSVGAIKGLLNQKTNEEKIEEKDAIIDALNEEGDLTLEDLTVLRGMPLKDLLAFYNKLHKGEEENGTK